MQGNKIFTAQCLKAESQIIDIVSERDLDACSLGRILYS